MICAGFDPGLACPGLAVIDDDWRQPRIRLARQVTTSPRSDLEDRWALIHDALQAAFDEYRPELLTIEEVRGVVLAQARTGRANADALRILEAVGLARAVALRWGARVQTVEPSAGKIALGCGGRAGKGEVVAAVRLVCSDVPAQLTQAAADAVGLALAGARRWRHLRIGGAA